MSVDAVMKKERLLIVGMGGHGRSVAEAVLLRDHYTLTAFLDDAARQSQQLCGYPVWGTTEMLEDCRNRVDVVVVAIGNNVLRETLQQRVQTVGMSLATVIHPAAIVSPSATVGQGSAIMAGAVVGTGAQLGEGVIVNSGAVIDHDCVVESFGHLGVNAGMAGASVLGRGAWMPVGSVLTYGAKVPSGRILRAGEVFDA